jgi:hypothetical protein
VRRVSVGILRLVRRDGVPAGFHVATI